MSIEIVTKEDLEDFRKRLIQDFKELLMEIKAPPSKVWLRTNDVLDVLGVSPGTLQNYITNKKLKPKKIGGLNYFHINDIKAALNSNE